MAMLNRAWLYLGVGISSIGLVLCLLRALTVAVRSSPSSGTVGRMADVWLAVMLVCITLGVACVVVDMNRAWRRRVWRASGRCLSCGYSRVGVPGACCPECGTAWPTIQWPRKDARDGS